jgi:hypothetical protein
MRIRVAQLATVGHGRDDARPATAGATTSTGLVSHGILPLPVGPATVVPHWNSGALSLRYGFPITGGKVNSATLAGYVNGNPSVRVRILNLDLTQAHVTEQPPAVTVTNVKATLTNTAAAALNQALGVSFFARGITLGAAQVHAHIG